MTAQVIDYLKKKKRLGVTKYLKNGEELERLSYKGTVKLARTIHATIEEMLPRAKAVRDFLQELARICAQHGKPLRWVTPLGLPVINEYHEPDIKQFTPSVTSLRGRTVRV
jgi:DNA-directed RNA polymerase